MYTIQTQRIATVFRAKFLQFVTFTETRAVAFSTQPLTPPVLAYMLPTADFTKVPWHVVNTILIGSF